MKEKNVKQLVFRKDGYLYGEKPLLLFMKHYFDTEKKMSCVKIRGAKNPLPFNEAYGINLCWVISWIKANGWTEIGHSYL